MLKKIFYKNLSGVPIHAWLLLTAICLIGYWPVSSNAFSLKNDAFVYFLPCRYFISECIQNGHLPLWNPYFYMGYPLHGDIQGGVWNPVVLLISLMGKYNMTTLQYETLLYILIAGIGMYKLTGIVSENHFTKLIVAAAYMFCGFIIDTGQITVWTGSAAFLPCVFLYYYRLLYQPTHIYKNALKTALALYFLFTAGYPSFLIMCCYVLFFSLLVCCISKLRQNGFNNNFYYTLLKANTVLAISFLLISLPALLSYLDYFPYYQRSSGTSLQQAQENPFNPFAIISYLFPLSVTKYHPNLSTDPTARSAYIGLFAFLMLTGIFRKKLSGLQKFILVTTLFIFLFSVGDIFPVRKFFYNYLPLMNVFRHPGTMRIFTTIGLLLLSSFYSDDLFIAIKERKARYYLWLSGAVIALISITVFAYSTGNNLPGKYASFKASIPSTGNIRSFLKDFYDSFSFADAILLEGVIQIFFLLAFIFLIRKKGSQKIKWIAAIFIINPLLLAQFSIPATFVTKQSPAGINHFIASSPANYPIPDMNASIAENNAVEKAGKGEYGSASFYTKKIVQVEDVINPSFTKSLLAFDNAPIIASTVMQYPVCYFADTLVHYKDSSKINATGKKILFIEDTVAAESPRNSVPENSRIMITRFAPWGLLFETSTSESEPFVLFQNFNKNWKLLIDGKDAAIKKGNISFMYATIEKGRHSLQFFYHPHYLSYSIEISLFTFLAMLVFLVRNTKNRN